MYCDRCGTHLEDQSELGQKIPMAMKRVIIPANSMPTENKIQRNRLQRSRYEDH